MPAPLAARFRPLGLLGSGAFGRVVLAEDQHLARRVAIKVLGKRGPEFEARFAREALLTARLAHPHVVAVYDHGVSEGTSWIVYEWVDGESLNARLERGGPMEPAEVARLGRELAGALAAAHRLGILHRDLKPANVMLRSDGRSALVDFGLGLDSRSRDHLTRTGAVVGTLTYLPPEVIRGELAGESGDQWSLAATLYRALTGELVRFEGAEPGSSGVDAKVQGLRPELPPGLPEPAGRLGEVLLKALSPRPEDRFRDVGELAEALAGGLDGAARVRTPRGLLAPSRAASEAGARRETGRAPGRGAALRLGLGLAATVVGLGWGARLAWGPAAPPGPEPAAETAEGEELAGLREAVAQTYRDLAEDHEMSLLEWAKPMTNPVRQAHVASFADDLVEPRVFRRLRRYLDAVGQLVLKLEADRSASISERDPLSAAIVFHLADDLAALEKLASQLLLLGSSEERSKAAGWMTSVALARRELGAAVGVLANRMTPWWGRYDSQLFLMRVAAESTGELDTLRRTLDEVHAAVMDPARPEGLASLLGVERDVLIRVPSRFLGNDDSEVKLLVESSRRVLDRVPPFAPGARRRELSTLLYSLMVVVDKKPGAIPKGAEALANELLREIEEATPAVPDPADKGRHPAMPALDSVRLSAPRRGVPWLVEFEARLGRVVAAP